MSYYSTTYYTSIEEIEKALKRSVKKGRKKKHVSPKSKKALQLMNSTVKDKK